MTSKVQVFTDDIHSSSGVVRTCLYTLFGALDGILGMHRYCSEQFAMFPMKQYCFPGCNNIPSPKESSSPSLHFHCRIITGSVCLDGQLFPA
jgi:hypothetical protein